MYHTFLAKDRRTKYEDTNIKDAQAHKNIEVVCILDQLEE
jgi:hypothetical protein